MADLELGAPVIVETVSAEAAVGGADWLSGRERRLLARFRSEKRRRDWLAGRLAAKRALSRLTGLPNRELEILTLDSGAPYCVLPGGAPAPAFSISHCAAGGVCAAAARGAVGVDWERPFEAGPRMLDLFAAPSERGAEPAGTPDDRARLWTLKEAVLKLLGLGMAGGLRSVRLTAAGLELADAALARWRELGAPAIRYRHEERDGAWLAVAHCA